MPAKIGLSAGAAAHDALGGGLRLRSPENSQNAMLSGRHAPGLRWRLSGLRGEETPVRRSGPCPRKSGCPPERPAMMRWEDGFKLTASALTSRPLRSLLTLLGVAIGIAAVALLTAIGEGLRHYVLDNFSQFGTRIVAIHPGKTQTGGLGG